MSAIPPVVPSRDVPTIEEGEVVAPAAPPPTEAGNLRAEISVVNPTIILLNDPTKMESKSIMIKVLYENVPKIQFHFFRKRSWIVS